MVEKSLEKNKIKKDVKSSEKEKKFNNKNIPSLQLRTEDEIAMDFAVKVYKKFDKMVKSIVLFGSAIKQNAVPGSDIDIMILIDDSSIKWDQELIAWYREELEKIIESSPYKKELHINTIKLSTWWEDLMKGDPVVLNILRYGEAMIDSGGFFNPLKQLLIDGKIKSTPEAIYSCLQRAPMHFARSKAAELGAIEGLYWTMVDSAHAALIAAAVSPPSPEHIPGELKLNFVNPGKLKMKYVDWFRDLSMLHKKINHGEITDLKGIQIDDLQNKTEDFLRTMAQLVNELIK
jgi:predicted nucleotidyltransferase